MAHANRSNDDRISQHVTPCVPITVYVLPFCARSLATVRELSRHGLDFDEVDLTTDPAARARVEALGYMRAPVVVAGLDHWAGYNPERISRMAIGVAKSNVSDFSAARPPLVLTER